MATTKRKPPRGQVPAALNHDLDTVAEVGAKLENVLGIIELAIDEIEADANVRNAVCSLYGARELLNAPSAGLSSFLGPYLVFRLP